MHCRYRVMSLALLILAASAFAQGPGGYNPIGPGVDLAGNWGPVFHEDAHERGPGPELVNYVGLPITDGTRSYGLAWNASRFTIPEHQCEVHIVSYIYRGPYNLRIWEERDPVSQKLIAIKQYIDNYQQSRTIWMDGRSHPPDAAPHTWMGFLHWKMGGTEYYDGVNEPNGDSWLIVKTIVEDPQYLAQPFITSPHFKKQPGAAGWNPTPCTAR